MADQIRHAVRALLVSPEREILLIHIVLPDRSFWITPGGAIKSNENPLAALERELQEETGARPVKIGPEVWTRNHTFEFEGKRILQRERFFLVHTDRFDPPNEMPDRIERRFVDRFRWWTLKEIDKSNEDFAPRRLAHFLGQLLEHNLPHVPSDVGA